jgi:multicomponent Na+:H+ antiporter subunit F
VSPFLLGFTLTVAVLIVLGLRRVAAGPTVFDRLIAVALVTVNGVVILVLLGFLFDRPAFFLDIALAYALLAFVLPIAVSRYFEQRSRHVDATAPGLSGPDEPNAAGGKASGGGRTAGGGAGGKGSGGRRTAGGAGDAGREGGT